MKFEWDAAKAVINFRKHRVSFEEAASVFLDPLAITGPDPDTSPAESRFITFGVSGKGRLVVVSHTYRSRSIRIISVRKVTQTEREIYEEG